MSDEAAWGTVIGAYVAVYGGFEISRQARRGIDFEVDRKSLIGAGTLLLLLVLWGGNAPPGIGILLLLVAGTVASFIWLHRVARALATPRWLVGLRRVALVLGAITWAAGGVQAIAENRWSDEQVLFAALFPLGYMVLYVAVEWALRGFLPKSGTQP